MSNVRSQAINSGGSMFSRIRSVNANKAAAAIIWLASAYGTSLLIEALRTNTSIYSIPSGADGTINSAVVLLWGSSFISALVLQALFTIGESSVWRRNQWDIVSSVTIVFDVLTNTAALYPFVRNFDNTSIWFMIQDLTGASSQFGPIAAFGLAVIGGIIGAAGPEKLWSRP